MALEAYFESDVLGITGKIRTSHSQRIEVKSLNEYYKEPKITYR